VHYLKSELATFHRPSSIVLGPPSASPTPQRLQNDKHQTSWVKSLWTDSCILVFHVLASGSHPTGVRRKKPDFCALRCKQSLVNLPLGGPLLGKPAYSIHPETTLLQSIHNCYALLLFQAASSRVTSTQLSGLPSCANSPMCPRCRIRQRNRLVVFKAGTRHKLGFLGSRRLADSARLKVPREVYAATLRVQKCPRHVLDTSIFASPNLYQRPPGPNHSGHLRHANEVQIPLHGFWLRQFSHRLGTVNRGTPNADACKVTLLVGDLLTGGSENFKLGTVQYASVTTLGRQMSGGH
jgi:hypothetical protein